MHLLNIIFSVKFIERAVKLKVLIDDQIFQLHPTLSKVINWYNMLILRYYNPFWYIPEHDEYAKRVYYEDGELSSHDEDQNTIFCQLFD